MNVASSAVKMISTPRLEELAEAAGDHNFSRQLSPETLDQLDPDGFHTLTVVVENHKCEGQDDPVHHRARILMKFTDIPMPNQAFLDITDSDWESLPGVPAQLGRLETR
jgi:hypothetical protein